MSPLSSGVPPLSPSPSLSCPPVRYADFLGRMNDERNLRALFERALIVLPSDQASAVWSKYADCERLYGDLESQLQLEQRRREACRGEGEEPLPPPTLPSVAARYAFRSLWPCLPAHLPPPTPVHHQEQELEQEQEPEQEPEQEQEQEQEGVAQKREAAETVWPDVGEMAIYDPRQGLGEEWWPRVGKGGGAHGANAECSW